MTRIFIADDHENVYDGLTTLFAQRREYDIVGHASNGQDALERINALRPDIVLLDIKMPKMTGLEVARQLAANGFTGKIIFLTQFEEEEYLKGALEIGATGYLLKDRLQDAVTAVNSVADGKPYFSPTLLSPIFKLRLENVGRIVSDSSRPSLTNREQELLDLILDGRSFGQIGEQLSLNQRTVEFHAANIRQKFGVTNIGDLKDRMENRKAT